MAAMAALPCRSSDKSMAAQARELGKLNLNFLGKVSDKSLMVESINVPR